VKPQVILLPGGVMPAEFAYSALLETLGEEVDAVAKELEISRTSPSLCSNSATISIPRTASNPIAPRACRARIGRGWAKANQRPYELSEFLTLKCGARDTRNAVEIDL
jgi:hypothetical protein